MANVKVYDENHRIIGATELSNDGSLIASQDVLGNVKIGSNINVSDDGTISVPNALQNTAGVIGVANVPSVAGKSAFDDTCSANIDGKIAIKKATANDFGVVKIGSGLTISSEDGTTSVQEPFYFDFIFGSGSIRDVANKDDIKLGLANAINTGRPVVGKVTISDDLWLVPCYGYVQVVDESYIGKAQQNYTGCYGYLNIIVDSLPFDTTSTTVNNRIQINVVGS